MNKEFLNPLTFLFDNCFLQYYRCDIILEVLGSLMGCDLGNTSAKAER
jgi:hypothetical protein